LLAVAVAVVDTAVAAVQAAIAHLLPVNLPAVAVALKHFLS
jgi:hypothetical protein